MSRADRRKQARENKHEQKFIDRNSAWYYGLPPDKKEFLQKVILAKIIDNDRKTAAIMDGCVIAAIDDVIGASSADEKKIIEISNGYMLDYKECIDKNGGDCDMSISIEDLNKVKTKIVKLRAEGFDKAKTIRELKKEFDIPNAILSDCWVEVKESEKTTLSKEEKDYVNADNKIAETANEIYHGEINGETIAGNNITIYLGDSKPGFKVKALVVEGKHDTYIKRTDGVSIRDGNVIYENVDDIKKAKAKIKEGNNAEIKHYNERLAELNKELEEVLANLKTVTDKEKKELEKLDEMCDLFKIKL